MNGFVKNKIKQKREIYEGDIKNRKTKNDYFKLQSVVNDVSEITDKRKNGYMSSITKTK